MQSANTASTNATTVSFTQTIKIILKWHSYLRMSLLSSAVLHGNPYTVKQIGSTRRKKSSGV